MSINDVCNFQIGTSKDKDSPSFSPILLSALIWKGAVMEGARAATVVHETEAWLRR